MQVSVTFRRMEGAEAVKEYAASKVAKINKYLYQPAEASIVLTREKHRIIAEINVTSQRFSLKGQEETEDVYSAIDLVVDKIERQLVKRKEKMRRHKSGSPAKRANRLTGRGSSRRRAFPSSPCPWRRLRCRCGSVARASLCLRTSPPGK